MSTATTLELRRERETGYAFSPPPPFSALPLFLLFFFSVTAFFPFFFFYFFAGFWKPLQLLSVGKSLRFPIWGIAEVGCGEVSGQEVGFRKMN